MSGSGGGVIIIRSLVDSSRCTSSERERLRLILDKNDILLSVRDALAVARIAFRICRRP